MYTIADSYAARVAPTCAAMAGGEVRTKPMNGKTAFMFPCPFCSPTRSKASKRRANDAILMPRVDKPYCLTFRCQGKCQTSYSFHEFLERWNNNFSNMYKHDLKKKKQKVYHHNFEKDDALRKIVNESNKTMKNNFQTKEIN